MPAISGNLSAGSTLTANPGGWRGAASFTYQWLSCDGNGNACHAVNGATAGTYRLQSTDTGHTFRVQVTARNAAGSTTATSDHTATIAQAGTPSPGNGCPAMAAGAQAVPVANVTAPARLQVTSFFSAPRVIPGTFSSFRLQVHVADTCGQAVQGAQIYATAVPFNQVTIPPKMLTDGAGNASLEFNRMRGFPASPKQELMVLFVRARKPGESLLAGISTRRLISLRVNLRAGV